VKSGGGKRIDAKILDVPKVYTSLSGFVTSIDVLFGHLRETEGGVRISVSWYWHAFNFSVLRAQDMRKGKEVFCGSEYFFEA
jgi:hypothetical protein